MNYHNSNPSHSPSVTRRKFIQYASLATLTAATTKLASCATPQQQATTGANSPSSGGTLRILSWAGYDEPEIIGKFEKENNVKVEFKTYVGGEQMLQFFNQSPPGTFDGIISDGEYVKKLMQLGAIDPLNLADFPNLQDFTSVYQKFPGFFQGDQMMAVGTRFGNYGIAYNKKFIQPEEVTSWNFLTNPKLKGKLAFFDWYLPNMGNTSLALFPNKPNPYDLSDQQLQQVKDWLVKVKPNVALITPSIQDITNAFINESVIAGPVGDWLIQNVIADGKTNFAAVVPKEGAIRWSEGAVVCSASKNKPLALKWVQYMTSPETQARLANAKAYKGIAPNLKAPQFMSDAEKQLLGYVPDKSNPSKTIVEVQLERTRARQLPVNQPEKVWQDLYNEFKTS
jgi:spermidine/putrescine transport system substrate-binding protein